MMKPRNGYTGFEVTEGDANRLKALFPPKYPKVYGHHITVEFGVPSTTDLPSGNIRIVGYVDDGSLEAFVVEVDGSTTRPDGATYHLTWSLDFDAGRKPVQSNDVLGKLGWTSIDPINITANPKFFSR